MFIEHSEKTKQRLSSMRIGIGNPFYGRKHSEETKVKMRASWTPDIKSEKSKKMRVWHQNHKSASIGRFHSEEEIQKMSEASRRNWTEDRKRIASKRVKLWHQTHINPMLGKRLSEEFKQKLSLMNSMENNQNWRGGKSFEPYGIVFNTKLKEKIRERDNHTCQECNYHQGKLKRKLGVHHIDYNKDNNDESNLISLCASCHTKTGYDRGDWTSYYQNKMLKTGEVY